jgi:probable addiction module antidote protein
VATKKRKKENFSRYDTADYLKSEADMVAYLEASMEEAGDDPAFVAVALGNIARAYGMVRLAKDTGLTREGLYKDSFTRRQSEPWYSPQGDERGEYSKRIRTGIRN